MKYYNRCYDIPFHWNDAAKLYRTWDMGVSLTEKDVPNQEKSIESRFLGLFYEVNAFQNNRK